MKPAFTSRKMSASNESRIRDSLDHAAGTTRVPKILLRNAGSFIPNYLFFLSQKKLFDLLLAIPSKIWSIKRKNFIFARLVTIYSSFKSHKQIGHTKAV